MVLTYKQGYLSPQPFLIRDITSRFPPPLSFSLKLQGQPKLRSIVKMSATEVTNPTISYESFAVKPPLHPTYDLKGIIKLALAEDAGDLGDITCLATIPFDMEVEAYFLAKEDGIVAGIALAEMIFNEVDPSLKVEWSKKDGDFVHKGLQFGKVHGRAHNIVVAERVVLNFMQRMSGIATLTKAMANAASPAYILETRKTAPCLRLLDKWAVLIGGGRNHRMGLFDMVMIKDNHISTAGGVTNALKAVDLYLLDYITRALGSCVIASAIWLAKTLLIKLLSSHFQSSRFFDRVQESIFHQYILRTLSGPPLMEMAVGKSSSGGRLSFKTLIRDNEKKGKKEQEQVIDVDKLKKMKQEKVSAWTMKGLINVIRSSGLSTISYTPESIYEDVSDNKDNEITSEWEAKAAAFRIFRNVAKPGSKCIEKEDLWRFMRIEEVENLLPLFEGAVETGRIKRKSLKNWLVKVYLERRSLVHSLNDAKTAVDELNNLASAIVLVLSIIVWLLVMGLLTTQVLVFISSQLLLVVFVFGNTAKTVFEAIIFVFVMHPFDVGDRCVIDGVQMIVEEMNILTTIFLRYDNEKIFYPNSVLATKPISNFYRSPEMSDSVEFAVDVSTSIENIGALKTRLKAYLESRPQHWRPNHNVIVKDIENVNKMKMALYVNHTINFQNYTDKSSRRSELVLELKKTFEDLDIKYHLLPQEVHLDRQGNVSDEKQRNKGRSC